MAFKLRRAQILSDLILSFTSDFIRHGAHETEFNREKGKEAVKKERTVSDVVAGVQSDLLGIRTNVMIRKVSNSH